MRAVEVGRRVRRRVGARRVDDDRDERAVRDGASRARPRGRRGWGRRPGRLGGDARRRGRGLGRPRHRARPRVRRVAVAAPARPPRDGTRTCSLRRPRPGGDESAGPGRRHGPLASPSVERGELGRGGFERWRTPRGRPLPPASPRSAGTPTCSVARSRTSGERVGRGGLEPRRDPRRSSRLLRIRVRHADAAGSSLRSSRSASELGWGGFEPPASSMSRRCHNRLDHQPSPSRATSAIGGRQLNLSEPAARDRPSKA